MRILHTIDSAGLYGAETVLLNLASEQRRRSDHPLILSIGDPGCAPKALETEAGRLGIACTPVRMRTGISLVRAILRIAAREHVDVIHSHGYKTNILMAAVPRKRRRVPVVTTLHGWTARTVWSKLGLYRSLDQLALRRLDCVVTVNRGLLHTRALRTLDKVAVSAIPNGIPQETPISRELEADSLSRALLELRSRFGVLVGAVGRLSAEKNFSALLDAIALTRPEHNIGVAILGDGPQAAALRAQIEHQQLSQRVLLAGYTPHARQYLRCFDMLVIPSLTEGLPMILLESLAAGVPVVATRVGDIPAALGNFGLVVEPGDPDGLARAIDDLVMQLPAYRAKAPATVDRIRREYGTAAMAARYDDVYQTAIARAA